jgi:hypothetical protein
VVLLYLYLHVSNISHTSSNEEVKMLTKHICIHYYDRNNIQTIDPTSRTVRNPPASRMRHVIFLGKCNRSTIKVGILREGPVGDVYCAFICFLFSISAEAFRTVIFIMA